LDYPITGIIRFGDRKTPDFSVPGEPHEARNPNEGGKYVNEADMFAVDYAGTA
jgi:hypothetical protein